MAIGASRMTSAALTPCDYFPRGADCARSAHVPGQGRARTVFEEFQACFRPPCLASSPAVSPREYASLRLLDIGAGGV